MKFILLKFIANNGRALSLAFRHLNVDRYSFTIRMTIQVQTQKMACFSKIIWNFEINSKTLREIDKRKLCTKFDRGMTTREYSRLFDETVPMAEVF